MKIELTKERLMAAHEKGCRTGKAMIEALAPELFEKPKTYHRGQRFRTEDGEDYILATAGDCYELVLVCLRSGIHYCGPAKVNDFFAVTEQEFERICDGDKFTLIS